MALTHRIRLSAAPALINQCEKKQQVSGGKLVLKRPQQKVNSAETEAEQQRLLWLFLNRGVEVWCAHIIH